MIPAWGEGLPCEGPMQAGQGAVADFPALKNMMKSDQYYVMYYFIRKNISLYIYYIYIYMYNIYIYMYIDIGRVIFLDPPYDESS